MSAEFIIWGLKGVGEGLVSSFISGGMDIGHAKEGGEELADVVATTMALTGACVLASVFLHMPPFVPIAISVFIRAGRTAEELYLKLKS